MHIFILIKSPMSLIFDQTINIKICVKTIFFINWKYKFYNLYHNGDYIIQNKQLKCPSPGESIA